MINFFFDPWLFVAHLTYLVAGMIGIFIIIGIIIIATAVLNKLTKKKKK